jgi:hypothetical protein
MPLTSRSSTGAMPSDDAHRGFDACPIPQAIKQSLWAVYCWSFLALLLLLAVVTACIMWMILPATHKHHHSSQRQLIAPLPEDRGPATPLSTTERFPLNWTVMVGDETMRATFMALARQVMQEKTLTSSFEPDDDEGSAVDPGTAGRVDAASADSDILDSGAPLALASSAALPALERACTGASTKARVPQTQAATAERQDTAADCRATRPSKPSPHTHPHASPHFSSSHAAHPPFHIYLR